MNLFVHGYAGPWTSGHPLRCLGLSFFLFGKMKQLDQMVTNACSSSKCYDYHSPCPTTPSPSSNLPFWMERVHWCLVSRPGEGREGICRLGLEHMYVRVYRLGQVCGCICVVCRDWYSRQGGALQGAKGKKREGLSKYKYAVCLYHYITAYMLGEQLGVSPSRISPRSQNHRFSVSELKEPNNKL